VIFMSQSGIIDCAKDAAWDEWYREHLRVMRRVSGITSANRYMTGTPGWPPSLAMYSVVSPAVFDDPYYLSIRGMGNWLPLIDRRYYRRNLFEGLDAAPAVTPGQVLLVTDQESPVDTPHEFSFLWLRSVGLDRSTPWRGIAVAPARDAERLRAVDGIAVYVPSEIQQ
jgi:hypothetical protein